MYKIDLHTHSEASSDGGLSLADYREMLATGKLDFIAITDHDTLSFAAAAHKKLGNRIIVGQEISTAEGEIIGLFLKRSVPAGWSVADTIHNIRAQDGLVYIPHPFEKVRQGLSAGVLENIAQDVDVIEIYNGRAYLQDKSAAAVRFAGNHQLAGAASSDAHGRIGWGHTYSIIDREPSRGNLINLLNQAEYCSQKVGPRGIIYPKLNRLKKRIKYAA